MQCTDCSTKLFLLWDNMAWPVSASTTIWFMTLGQLNHKANIVYPLGQ